MAFWRRARRVLVIALLLPYVLTLGYRFIPPFSTLMLADALTLHKVERHWVPLDKIAPSLVASVVLTEDSAFCDHFGFDFKQMQKSLEEAQAYGTPPRGASTISQQTAKNLYLWNGRFWLRKILEAPLTLWLEIIWPKRRIMEVYLNIAEWGDGIYGADAAARHYFGVSAAQLSPWQSALLAASLPDPKGRSAGRPGPWQQGMAAQIVERLATSRPNLSCLQR